MKNIITLVLLFICNNALSAPIAIQSCLTDGTCFVGRSVGGSTIDGNVMSAYNFTDYRSGIEEQKVLMEYQIGSSSHIDDLGFDSNTNQNLPLQTTSITGSVWLETSVSYDLTNPLHALTLYFDQATPAGSPASIWTDNYSGSNEQHLQISTSGLLNGFGEAYASGSTYYCEDLNGFPIDCPNPEPFSSSASSNPTLFDSFGDPTLSCLAEGCYTGAMLNLLGIQYLQDGNSALFTINPDETRSLLYLTTSGGVYGDTYEYTGYTDTTYSMSETPVPAAVWLFSSGLIGLIGFARRKKV